MSKFRVEGGDLERFSKRDFFTLTLWSTGLAQTLSRTAAIPGFFNVTLWSNGSQDYEQSKMKVKKWRDSYYRRALGIPLRNGSVYTLSTERILTPAMIILPYDHKNCNYGLLLTAMHTMKGGNLYKSYGTSPPITEPGDATRFCVSKQASFLR